MFAETKSLNEECGVFGIWGDPEASQLTYFGLHSLQHRGQEGAGIVSCDDGELLVHRNLGLISEVFKNGDDLKRLSGDRAIGHVRYSTSGQNSIENVQPFLYHFYDLDIAICHNGNLVNAKSLRRSLEEDGAIFHSTSDTEVLIHLIRRSQKGTLIDKIKESLNLVKGGFTYVLMTDKRMFGAVDANSLRPLVIGKLPNGAYVMASETCAIDTIGAEFVRNVNAGELAIIDANGLTIEKYTEDTTISIAAMEYIYFARPDSNIAGVNVHTARKRMGKCLAVESPMVNADIVIGVPNSSLSAASGFAEESGTPYEMGLIKNQYVGRTFIQPTQELRELGAKMKLSAVKGVVQGKIVVMVDDSIVRGTTSKRIVTLLKEAGAKEVHVRISSPPLIYPSFYGIDISKSAELIAARMTVPQICEYIGADSLSFLSQEGLIDSIGLKFDSPYSGLCMDSFNGDYPAGLYDYEEDYVTNMTEIQKENLRGG
ncbi:amidophosphoribosyltransferase [Carnobacterium pleistocenium]|uniref:amidophosphoribosyltransferase n=1 Tax=Carnobacterium pleistocenium TaxID=181073 RepID=UPI000557A688|nr:amidophosphoribosyltransferase [Carnobacterium pleistocenium]